ncbi:MAG: methyltransferase [Dehalococcoidia bacterium]
MEAPPPDILHTERDDRYLAMLRAEEEFWDTHIETPLTRTPKPAVQAYLNERMTGDPQRRWFEVISDYGNFQRGCMLGAGPGHVEEHLLDRHPGLTLTIMDISGGALERLQERLDKTYPGRAETRQSDLNFVELPEGAYDLVAANSSLHHIVNLEHLAFQVNQSLTPEGFFFMEDTVSESYFQFSDGKKHLFQSLMDATQDGFGQRTNVVWPDRDDWTFSPFESVRSGEILEILARYLREERVNGAAALMSLTIFVRQAAPQPGAPGKLRRLAKRLLARQLRPKMDVVRGKAKGELLFAIDTIICDAGLMPPGLAFGVYRKRMSG